MIRTAAALPLLLAGCIQTVVQDLDGPNARNTGVPGAGLIVIDPDTADFAAVWAQEYYEAQQKVTPDGAARYMNDRGVRRAAEIMGHEIEVQVAVALYGADEAERRAFEARSLATYPAFSGLRPARIARLMRAEREAALAWIAQNRGSILAQAARG